MTDELSRLHIAQNKEYEVDELGLRVGYVLEREITL